MSEIIDLSFENKKQWFKAVLLGFLIGLAVILPGISGATIAIIFGLYSQLIYSFGNIVKQFKKCFMFLLPIGIGIVIGFIVGFFFVQGVFEAQPFIVICLFSGLMIGSFPAVVDEIRGMKWSAIRVLQFVVGVLIPILIGVGSIFIKTPSASAIVATPTIMILYLVMGFVISLTQIVPGLSCSALLMAFGQFGAILASIEFNYLKENPLVIITLLLLVVGFVVGIVVFSSLLNRLFKSRRDGTFTMIVGLSLGSIVTMFLNPDIFAVYNAWDSGSQILKEVGIGVVLLAVGVVISYILVLYQRNVNKSSKNVEANIEKTEQDGVIPTEKED